MHWLIVNRILYYLKYIIDYGLYLTKDPSSSLYTYSDANWAGDPHDRYFVSGFNIFLGPNLIFQSAKK